MTKLFLSLATILIFSSYSFAYKVPEQVKKAFEQKFTNATKITWERENFHEFEAHFILEGVPYSSNFSDRGEWLETECTITFNALPNQTQAAFIAAHKNAKVKNVSRIETSKGTVKYEIEFKNKLRIKELVYDENGMLR